MPGRPASWNPRRRRRRRIRGRRRIRRRRRRRMPPRGRRSRRWTSWTGRRSPRRAAWGVRRVGVRRCLLLNLGRLVRALRDLVAGDGARRGEPDGDAAANERRRADASAPAGAEGAEASDRDGPPTGRGRRSRDGSGKETRGPNLGAKERRRGHGRVRARRCGPRVRREASASTLTREMSGRADPCVPGARGSGSTGRRLDWGHCVASFFFARE